MAKAGKPSRVTPQDRSADTRRALVDAAITTLKTEGFIGASARTIAARAGCNQGLVFYHFGSVASLLLAALDSVSAARRERFDLSAERLQHGWQRHAAGHQLQQLLLRRELCFEPPHGRRAVLQLLEFSLHRELFRNDPEAGTRPS